MTDTLAEYKIQGRDVDQVTRAPPTLAPDQIDQEMAAIPPDYWTLESGSCRDKWHSTFTCPTLTSDQLIFFDYRYYLNQVSRHPMLKEWYNQKREALRGKCTDPGPRPSTYQDGRGGRCGAYGGYDSAGPPRVLRRDDNKVAFITPDPQPQGEDDDISHHSSSENE